MQCHNGEGNELCSALAAMGIARSRAPSVAALYLGELEDVLLPVHDLDLAVRRPDAWAERLPASGSLSARDSIQIPVSLSLSLRPCCFLSELHHHQPHRETRSIRQIQLCFAGPCQEHCKSIRGLVAPRLTAEDAGRLPAKTKPLENKPRLYPGRVCLAVHKRLYSIHEAM